MRTLFLTIVTAVSIGAFAGAATAGPYSCDSDKKESKPVMIGS